MMPSVCFGLTLDEGAKAQSGGAVLCERAGKEEPGDKCEQPDYLQLRHHRLCPQ